MSDWTGINMKIALGADHRGHAMKEKVVLFLGDAGHEIMDMGTNSRTSVDYPDVAYPTAKAVADGRAERGILICGSGIGMDICANKVPGVRSALCHDELTAQMSRRHNNANVLCLASDIMSDDLLRNIINSWLVTEFEGGGRHTRRVEKMGMIEEGKDPGKFDG